MKIGVTFSVLLHIAVVVVSVVGLPHIRKPPPVDDVPMIVELVTIAEKTELPPAPEPKPEKKPEPKPEPKPVEAKKPEPPPPPKEVKPPPPPPPPPPKPEPEVAAVPPPPPPKPEPKEKPKPKPEPKPEAKPEPKPKAPQKLAKLKPKRKPKPPDPFASVLKNLAAELKQPTPKAKEKAKKPESEKQKDNFENEIAQVLSQKRVSDSASRQISLTERQAMINEIRKAVSKCWSFQSGAKGAEDFIVEIKVAMRSDGHVAKADILNPAIHRGNPFRVAAAESAYRAVLNPACQPFKLDPRKYDVWKNLTLSFNPREMLGR